MESKNLYLRREFLSEEGLESFVCRVDERESHVSGLSGQKGLDVEVMVSDGGRLVCLTNFSYGESDLLETVSGLRTLRDSLSECIDTVDKYYENQE